MASVYAMVVMVEAAVGEIRLRKAWKLDEPPVRYLQWDSFWLRVAGATVRLHDPGNDFHIVP